MISLLTWSSLKAVLASPASSLVDSLRMEPCEDLGTWGWGWGCSSLAWSLRVLLWGMSPVDPKLESLENILCRAESTLYVVSHLKYFSYYSAHLISGLGGVTCMLWLRDILLNIVRDSLSEDLFAFIMSGGPCNFSCFLIMVRHFLPSLIAVKMIA